LGLEWSRVDLTRKVALLDRATTKTGDGRGIPRNADAVAAFEATRGKEKLSFVAGCSERQPAKFVDEMLRAKT
jgi:hypothetical protein